MKYLDNLRITILFLCLFVSAFFLQAKVFTYNDTESNIIYSIDPDAMTAEVKGPVTKSFSTNLVIPDEIEYVGVKFPVTSIASEAFYNCTVTGSLTIGNSVQTIGSKAFYNCKGFTGSLVIGNSVQSIGDSAFQDCSGFTGSLTIPDSVQTIGSNAFYDCIGFTGSLTIGNSVQTIGSYAFYNCKGFTGTLTIGNSVQTIGSYAFYNCKGFTGTLTIGNSVKTIGDYAFNGCSGFTGSLTIGNSVQTIGDYAFYNCKGFTGSLTIPESVKQIKRSTFYGCIFDFVTCKSSTPPTCYYYYITVNGNIQTSFDSSQHTKPLYVPKDARGDYQSATGWKEFYIIWPIVVPAEDISLNKSELKLVLGQSETLVANVEPTDADYTISWTSDNSEVATVSEDGTVKAMSGGVATITATTDNGLSASCEVYVWYMGDVNKDDVINIADITVAVNYIAGLEPEDFTLELADINADGDVTVTDAVLIAQMILSAENDGAEMPLKVNSLKSTSHYLNYAQRENMISLSLPESGYTALQADIKLPQGVTLDDISIADDYRNSHIMMTADKGDNTVRLVIFSLNNSELRSNEEFVNISLNGAANGSITGSNIIASDANGQVANLTLANGNIESGVENIDNNGNISIKSEINGVTVTGASQQQVNVYSIDGRLISAIEVDGDNLFIPLTSGLYVIKVADLAKKVIIK